VVYPAAGLIRMARDVGAALLEFNIERTAASRSVDVGLYGPAGRLLPEVVRHL
jgi:NAD-dependent deacetylase